MLLNIHVKYVEILFQDNLIYANFMFFRTWQVVFLYDRNDSVIQKQLAT